MTETLPRSGFDHAAANLDDCDREPIHIPGSIQPHGLLLVVDRESQRVRYAAGDVEGRLGREDWQGASLDDLFDADFHAALTAAGDQPRYAGRLTTAGGEILDVSASGFGGFLLVELEPAAPQVESTATRLAALEAAGLGFERSASLKILCERAAREFGRLTGYERVMVYRFLDDEAGVVVAEHLANGVEGFLNHHFPGSDIPRQARALYVRNLVRVIPDSHYSPAPLRPGWSESEPLDMSDCALRSVSPIHVQYLRNMGVRASASVSIVKDGHLWGLIACHDSQPKLLPFETRVACRALAGGLARQIKAKEEAEGYRERIRLRGFEDDIVAGFGLDRPLEKSLAEALPWMQRMMDADGVALVSGGKFTCAGEAPNKALIAEAVPRLVDKAVIEPFSTDRWAEEDSRAEPMRDRASGVLAVTLSADEPLMLIWFRAEHQQVVEWAGNPHKQVPVAGGPLTPRASFDAWAETVRGRARPWTPAQTESALRLRSAIMEARHGRRLRELNQRLAESLADRETLIQQKDFLIKEVNHRVQNSLTLVSSFLGLQGRASDSAEVKEQLGEARRRLGAVAMVHRRLYRADQVESVDLARYLEDLLGEMSDSMGAEWAGQLALDLQPVVVGPDRAVTLGLVTTELLINAQKYAYGGRPGPLEVALEQAGANLRLAVADRGQGGHKPGQGFGSRMMAAMVSQLEGRIDYLDNDPGLRALLTAPLTPGG